MIVTNVAVVTVVLTSRKISDQRCSFTLQKGARISIGNDSHPQSIVVGDFNNDNWLDIAVVNTENNNIGVFIGKNGGSFTDQISYYTGDNSIPRSIAVADVNNDFQQDLLVANFGINEIAIFLGIGNGSFYVSASVSTGSSRPLYVNSADFNNDNQSDIITVNYGTNSISIFYGLGDSSFRYQVSFFTGYDSYPISIALGDFNHDSLIDIAVLNFEIRNVHILLNYGNELFRIQTLDIGKNSNPRAIVAADFNHDSRLDLAICSSGTNSIDLYFGYENGYFEYEISLSTGNNSFPLSIVVGDYNADNYLDIAVANHDTSNIGIFTGSKNGIFQDQIIYSTHNGSHSYSIVSNDFNKDNKSDIVVANYDTNNLRVLITKTQQTFIVTKSYRISDQALLMSVSVGDFNNDHHLDIVVTDTAEDSIGFLFGYGNGSFSTVVTYSTGTNSWPISVFVGDFNNDNFLDVVVANSEANNIGFLFGYGNGTFSEQTTYSTGRPSRPISLAAADLNNDRFLDIAVANYYGHNIGIFLGNGHGSFNAQVTYATDFYFMPKCLAIGDLNNDNRSDIVVVGWFSENIWLYFGEGDGTFSVSSAYSSGTKRGIPAVALGDCNNDGALDIFIANYYLDSMEIFLGFGNGTFGKRLSHSTLTDGSPDSFILKDINNDNQLDIIVINSFSRNIGAFFGYGDGDFSSFMVYPIRLMGKPESIALGTFDDDDILDAVVSNSDALEINILQGIFMIQGEENAVCYTGSAARPQSIAVGDLNNDNWIDIAVGDFGTEDISIFFGHDNQIFTPSGIYLTGLGSSPTSVVVADLNDDENLDIAIANSGTHDITIMFGHGNGSFDNQNKYFTDINSYPHSIAVADFNNDGKVDMVVSHSGTKSLGVLLKYDVIGFHTMQKQFTGDKSFPMSIAVGDMNWDGKSDIIVANIQTSNILIFYGDGDGQFSSQSTIQIEDPFFPYSIIVHDFNQDGRLDIAATSPDTDRIHILIAHENNSFVHLGSYSTGVGSTPISLVSADLNNDSCLDIIVANFNGYGIGIFLGHGDGTFDDQVVYLTGSDSAVVSIAVGYFNKDEYLDVAATDYTYGTIIIFFGNGNGTLSNPSVHSIGPFSAPMSIVTSDFNNDSMLDVAVTDYTWEGVRILFGDGNGGFSREAIYSTGVNSGDQYLAAKDLNNDGIVDLIFADRISNTITALHGLKDGTFFSEVKYYTGDYSSPTAIALDDFNGDKRLDLVVANADGDNVGIFLGYGYEDFLKAPIYSTGSSSQPTYIAVGDFNSDSHIDVATINNGTDNIIIVFGSGIGTFNSQITLSTGNRSYPSGIAIGDLNKDEYLDVVVANSGTNSITIFHGYGNGTFSDANNFFIDLDSNPYAVAILDMNNDTLLDVAVANFGTNNVIILFGYKNGNFTSREIFQGGFQSNPFALAVGDINRDDLPDIIVVNNGYGTIDFISQTC